jgi:hypothetical protein
MRGGVIFILFPPFGGETGLFSKNINPYYYKVLLKKLQAKSWTCLPSESGMQKYCLTAVEQSVMVM